MPEATMEAVPTNMEAGRRDHVVTIAAIGLLAYLSADLAHHAIGHAGACLALGGHVTSLSSVLVLCSAPGAAFAIAGPAANLAVGILALLVARFANRGQPSTARMFWLLAAGFNLFWFAGQLVFDVATKSDDWAWAMQPFHIGIPARVGLIACGAFAYVMVVRILASEFAAYARPRARAGRIVLIVWLTAGAVASGMAALDHNAVSTLLRAFPQSLALPIGLLFVPPRAARRPASGEPAPDLVFSIPWAVAAAIAGVAAILVFG